MLDLRRVAEVAGIRPGLRQVESAGGGCINQALVAADSDGRRYFIKYNRADLAGMFAAESEGLQEIEACGAIRVPHPLCHGVAGMHAFLLLEYLPLSARGDAAELGRQLASMHRHTAERFGWRRDNTIGATPQANAWQDDWTGFWREQRLRPQFERAACNAAPQHLLAQGRNLLAALDELLAGHRPQASLLHGDLWAGNHAYWQGRPVLIDPAVYYGDRETDLAMSALFGGFPPDFYAAYQAAWPLAPGYERRRVLYNLYHVLNHFNLFGGSYAGQASRMCEQLAAA